MDPSRVAMVDFEWPKTVFEEYTADAQEKMCINITELLKLLRRTSKGESVELALDEKTGRLNVGIKGKYDRTFNMPTLEATEPSKATFSLSYLSEIIKTAAATSDIATLEFSTDMPIRIDFQQPKEGKLTFYLAPSIEVE